MGDSIEGLPEQLQQYYYFQKGMISLVAGDNDAARNFFEKAIRDESDQTWNGKQVMYATILSALHLMPATPSLQSKDSSVRNARCAGPGSTVWMMPIFITRNPVFMH